MKFFPHAVLHGLDDQPIMHQEQAGAASVPLTLGFIAVEALVRDFSQDSSQPGNLKVIRYNLAKRIKKELSFGPCAEERSITVTAEEIGMIKQRILIPAPNGFPTPVVGPAINALEGEDPEAKVSPSPRALEDFR